MNESIQIVRKQMGGDFIPAYSTDVLLMGVCHITHFPGPREESVEYEQKAKESPLKKRVCSLTDEYYESRSRFYAEERAKLIPIIREKLLEKKTKTVIAREIEKGGKFLLRVIRSSDELAELAKQLPKSHGRFMAQKHKERFELHEANIRQWLIEGKTYQFIADRIGAKKPALSRYISNRPDVHALCQRRRK